MNPTGPESPRLPGVISLPGAVRALEAALDGVPPETSGSTIGPYKLLQKLGEGGFGVVWMAEQHEPIRRRLALKIIKTGMDTEDVIARFEAERQALALMDHPNIARVFDAGATNTGRPFFVMELVRGIAITRYCDENRLSPSDRLRLFIAVCKAVQHAHQKGIIHRDLKPSNILVTLHDGVPVPKIIDFGIAKATDKQLTDKTLFTQFHAFIGTPAYTAPEQMEMSALDVDTRSDIYSLGVLLYELLAGRPPFDPEALAKSGLDAMRRTIREVDPPRPSIRLGTLTDAERTTIAGQRGTDTAKLSLLLRGDLDWIAMRCLEKDRTRRYETANGLARDIERHLAHEPVSARPPSTLYRSRKFIRRHKVGVAAAAAITSSLVAGVIVSSTLYFREHASRARAVAAEAAETRLRQQAEEGRAAEARRASRASLALAQELLSAGRTSEGLAHLVRAGRSDPTNAAVGSWLISALAARSFPEPVGIELAHPGSGLSARYSKDGRHALTLASDDVLRYWDLGSGRLLQRWDAARHMASDDSSDGRLTAVGSADGTVRVWELATGRLVFEGRHERGIWRSTGWTVRFSPDSRWLATASSDGTARIWDTSSGEIKATLRHNGIVIALAFSPDSSRLISYAGLRWQLWRVTDGQPLPVSLPAGPGLTDVYPCFTPDGTLVAINVSQGVQFFEAATGAAVGQGMVQAGAILGAAFTPDGKEFVTMSRDSAARLWEVPSGRLLHTLRHGGAVTQGRFTPDSRHLITDSGDGMTRIWNTEAGQFAQEPVHVGNVDHSDVSPDGTEFMTIGRDGVVRRWRLGSGEIEPLKLPAAAQRRTIARKPGTPTAWAIYEDRMQKIDLLSGRAIASPRPLPLGFSHPMLAPNEAYLSVRTGSGEMELWDLRGNEIIRRPTGEHTSTGGTRRFSSDSAFLTMQSPDGVRVWETATGRLVGGPFVDFSIQQYSSEPLSPDGRQLALANDDVAAVFDVGTGRIVGEPMLHRQLAVSPVFSPDGSLLATGSGDGLAQLWNPRTARPVGPPMPHRNGTMRGLRFTRDGRRLLTWNRQEVYVWEVGTSQSLTGPMLSGTHIVIAAFSEDETLIASYAHTDGRIRIWNSATGQLLCEPLNVAECDWNMPPSFHGGGKFLAAGLGGSVHVSAVPPYHAGQAPPAWLLRLATAFASSEIDERGKLRELPFEAKVFDELRRELAASPVDAPYVEWGRWILADRATRPIAPGFKITATEAARLGPVTGPVSAER